MKHMRFPTEAAARAAVPSNRYEVIRYHDRPLDQWLYMVRRVIRPKRRSRRRPQPGGPEPVAYTCEFHPDRPCQFPHKCQVNLGCTHERGRHRTERLPWQTPKPTTTVRPVGFTVQYAYAGFEYRLTKRGPNPFDWFAEPLPGQHHAAGKERHKNAAISAYRAEYKES